MDGSGGCPFSILFAGRQNLIRKFASVCSSLAANAKEGDTSVVTDFSLSSSRLKFSFACRRTELTQQLSCLYVCRQARNTFSIRHRGTAVDQTRKRSQQQPSNPKQEVLTPKIDCTNPVITRVSFQFKCRLWNGDNGDLGRLHILELHAYIKQAFLKYLTFEATNKKAIFDCEMCTPSFEKSN